MKGLTAALLCLAAVLAGLLLYRNQGGRLPLYGTTIDTAPAISGPVLRRDDGVPVTFGGPAPQLRLVFFGFTRCPDVCPITLGVLARAYQSLTPQQREQVQVQLVSVDPQHDTPAVLRQYLNRFDPSFRGFTGTEAQTQQAAKSFYVMNTRSSNNTILHGEEVAVLDKQGHYRRVYGGGSIANGEFAKDLPRLLKVY